MHQGSALMLNARQSLAPGRPQAEPGTEDGFYLTLD